MKIIIRNTKRKNTSREYLWEADLRDKEKGWKSIPFHHKLNCSFHLLPCVHTILIIIFFLRIFGNYVLFHLNIPDG